MDKALIARIGADLSDLRSKMDEAKGLVGGFTDQIEKLGPMITGAFSVGAIVAFGKAAITAAGEAIDGENRLLVALHGREDVQKRLLKQADDIQGRTLFEDDDIIKQQAMLAALGRNETQIKKVIEAAIQLSTATGTDLSVSVEALNKTYEGLDRGLKAIDPSMQGLTATQLRNGEAVDLISGKYKNFAESAAQVGSGPIKNLTKQFGEFVEDAGRPMLSVINDLILGFKALDNDALSFSQKLKGFDRGTLIEMSNLATALKNNTTPLGPPSTSLPFNPNSRNVAAAGKINMGVKISGSLSKVDLNTSAQDELESQKALNEAMTQLMQDNYKEKEAADQAYTDYMKDQHDQRIADEKRAVDAMIAQWQAYGTFTGNQLALAISGQEDFAKAFSNVTRQILGDLAARAAGAAITNAFVSAPPWIAVGLAAAGVALVKTLFSTLGASSSSGSYSGGSGSASRVNASMANGSLQTIQVVGSAQVSGTQMNILFQNQQNVNAYTGGYQMLQG